MSKIYLFRNAWTGDCPIVYSQDYPMITHTYTFSIQFLHQTADSFGVSITQFVKYGWNGMFYEPDTLNVIANWSCHRWLNNEHLFLKVSPPELSVASWLFIFHSQSYKWVLILVNEWILYPLVDSLAQLYVSQYTIYTFNKENIEHVTQDKQGHS